MGIGRDHGDLVRSITPRDEPLFLCPQCRQPLPVKPPCFCGFVLRESDGVINLMTKDEIAQAQPFLDAYALVRDDERWGGDDLDLPFHPKRHHRIWAIRRRTFRVFESIALKLERGLALDIGAGNCWMTRYLDLWGYDAIAVDVNISQSDGLRAGQKFIDEGRVFLRTRAGMERLPFASGRITLVATNASFHYACDFRDALSEFERVLTPGGVIAIIDTPFYENTADGEKMMAERATEFQSKYGMAEALARRSRYLTFQGIEELAAELKLSCKVHRVWPGWERKAEEIRGKLVGRRIAQFPLVVLEKR
jgi:SAM-dependent methyltransferase